MNKTTNILLLVTGCIFILFSNPVVYSAPGDILYERIDKADVETFPEAIFPHWKHRILYRCDACHDSLFEMKKGATPVTMKMIGEGEVCGSCHNGELAFGDDFTSCARCHYIPKN